MNIEKYILYNVYAIPKGHNNLLTNVVKIKPSGKTESELVVKVMELRWRITAAVILAFFFFLLCSALSLVQRVCLKALTSRLPHFLHSLLHFFFSFSPPLLTSHILLSSACGGEKTQTPQ